MYNNYYPYNNIDPLQIPEQQEGHKFPDWLESRSFTQTVCATARH